VRGMAWQNKSVPIIDGDRSYVNGWDIGGDQERRASVPEFSKVLADLDKDHDGRLSRAEAAAQYPPPLSPQSFADSDLDENGYIDEREWRFYQIRSAAENCLVAIRAGGRGDAPRGDITRSRVLWRYRKALPNTASPLLYEGVLYLVRDGIFTSLNAETGEVMKQARLTGALGNYWASPVEADRKIFLASEEGKVVVVSAEGNWEIQSINNLDEEIFATPAIVDSRIYVRTREALWCFAKGGK
jgi:outer membrane protein assembly factor BamB